MPQVPLQGPEETRDPQRLGGDPGLRHGRRALRNTLLTSDLATEAGTASSENKPKSVSPQPLCSRRLGPPESPCPAALRGRLGGHPAQALTADALSQDRLAPL